MGLKRDRMVVNASRGATAGDRRRWRKLAPRSVTGKPGGKGDASPPGTVATAAAVTAAGGRGVAVYCDHAGEYQVEPAPSA